MCINATVKNDAVVLGSGLLFRSVHVQILRATNPNETRTVSV